MPKDIMADANLAREKIELTCNMDIVTKVFSDWINRRTMGIYDQFLTCLEKGPNEMQKEQFSYMDKINEANASEKFEVCSQEFQKLRQVTFNNFEVDFNREYKNWKNWKWKNEGQAEA